MRKVIMLTVLILCMTGCKEYDIDEILLQREDISITVTGAAMLVYDPATFQIGYNPERFEFRVFDDQMGNWFTLKCNSRPVEGQDVKADLRWTTPNTTRTRNGLNFSVEKTDSEGHIWMWCEEEAIGVVVREL